ncbi:thioredoxin-like [Haliotis rubra]|uniref:thioredoxin-like n=1 Tax=Haliotis rubra TaxID=36100 RepID=UPI001EE60CFD|nr:thioredoxin-like [Haliotis rubra]XP_046576715.1 thioredoxin-like [Haliotis rubra]XP_046576716.1 thioredoxin-like [Haliotis rubra]
MKVVKTKAEFDSVLTGSPGQLVVVDFFATWCPPCTGIAPFFEALSVKYPLVVFIKVDVDENEETAAVCEVEAMPTFKFYKDGKQVDELVGASQVDLEAKVEKNQ